MCNYYLRGGTTKQSPSIKEFCNQLHYYYHLLLRRTLHRPVRYSAFCITHLSNKVSSIQNFTLRQSLRLIPIVTADKIAEIKKAALAALIIYVHLWSTTKLPPHSSPQML